MVAELPIEPVYPVRQANVGLAGFITPCRVNLLPMTQRPFRKHHLLSLLTQFEEQSLPLDRAVNLYFRNHRALGPKDRKEIAEGVYGICRWQRLIDALIPSPATWESRIDCYQTFNPKEHQDRDDLPLAVRCSCPEELFQWMSNAYGEEKAFELASVANTPAPTTVRVNALKTTRDALMETWKTQFSVTECAHSPYGIQFNERPQLFSLPEFTNGFFEMQDEASQLVADLVRAEPGQQVMDYCAGSGGKTLAFAPKMNLRGQIFLHDIRAHALQEARLRLRRAGIQNAQVVASDSPKLNKLKKRMDWVLVDAPCTGTGTLRRNPDMKWRLDTAMLNRLVSEQRVIFEKALSFLKPGGHIVYATCSVLPQENQEQVERFMRLYGLKLEGEPFQCLPSIGGMDGFFGAVLVKNHSL